MVSGGCHANGFRPKHDTTGECFGEVARNAPKAHKNIPPPLPSPFFKAPPRPWRLAFRFRFGGQRTSLRSPRGPRRKFGPQTTRKICSETAVYFADRGYFADPDLAEAGFVPTTIRSAACPTHRYGIGPVGQTRMPSHQTSTKAPRIPLNGRP